MASLSDAAVANPIARVITPPKSVVEPGKVLVVDDSEPNRDLLSRRLKRQGHIVETASNGREAVEKVAAGDFDVVLLDVMMPEMNGYQVLERLKSDRALRHIPVIMITAIDEMESIIRCIDMGAEDHLPKPFNATLLKARLDASLAKKRLHDREQLYARGLERELEIARNIQQSFLPEVLPTVNGYSLAACFRPAREVAGDFYDVFTLADDRVALIVADVCGKGVGAAVFMAAFRTVLRAITSDTYATLERNGLPINDAAEIGRIAAFLSDYVATTHGRTNMFTTLFFGMLDPRSSTLSYVNGGHDAPILIRTGGSVERLVPTGPAVGLLPGFTFPVATTTLAAGDTLVAYTDGVVDARDMQGVAFSEDRLVDLVSGAEPSAPAMVSRIERAVIEHISGTDQFDDVTVLALRHVIDASLEHPAQ
jgi:serine phosphatase RsbU (regulator of sigma subunit)